MSLFGSLFSGVSALNAQAQAMGIIADNISNLNTVGFKSTVSRFATLVTTAATNTTFTPGGVQARPFALVEQQGLVQASHSQTDLAISGQGFFVVNQNADGSSTPLYTRAGSFHQDSLGNLVNTSGFFLRGWPLDASGRLPGAPGNTTNTTSSADLSSLVTVNVSSINGTAASTTGVDLGINLNATQAVLLGPQDTTLAKSVTSTADLGGAGFTLTDGHEFTVVSGADVTGTFVYDPVPAGGGVRNGLAVGSKVTAALGFNAFTFTSTLAEDTFQISYASSSRTLSVTKGDGSSQDVVLVSGSIAAGQTETATFSTFNLNVVLDSNFSKTADIVIDADTVSITGGTAAISAASIKIADSTGSLAKITDKTLTFTGFADATKLVLATNTGGFSTANAGGSGDIDGTNTGVQTFVLSDGNGNTMSVAMDITTIFANGAQSAASITLEELENLVVEKTATTNGFSSLAELSTLINAVTGLSASVGGATTDSTLIITGDDPRNTLVVTNTGSGTAGTALFGGSSPITIADTYDPAVASKNMASGNVSAHFSRAVRVFDAQGTGHDIQVGFLKVATNTWEVEVFSNPASDVNSVSPLVSGQIATGTISFNGDGSLGSLSTSLANAITVSWATGASNSSLSFNWGKAGPIGTGLTDGMSQFDGGFNVAFVNQNGSEVGELSGVSINQNGFVIASFSNGETTRLFKLPIATFADVSRLASQSGNVYAQSDGSGQFNLREAGRGGAGLVAPSALEAANVDIGKEFTDMIITQRAFSASSRVITTVDDLLDELIRIRR